jgi:hypothetical protein
MFLKLKYLPWSDPTTTSNKRHARAGHLFQGRFKAVLVQKDSHFLANPLPKAANSMPMGLHHAESVS